VEVGAAEAPTGVEEAGTAAPAEAGVAEAGTGVEAEGETGAGVGEAAAGRAGAVVWSAGEEQDASRKTRIRNITNNRFIIPPYKL
ncbi:MAG: hypothetical protein ACM3PY_19180, partial [Omnitrophica WOR_2 bacterium]